MLPPRPAAPVALRRRGAALHAGACTLPAARLPRGYPAASLAPPCGQAAPDAPASPCRTCRPAQALCCPHARACTLPAAPPASGFPACLSRPLCAGRLRPDALALLCSAPDAPSRRRAALTRAPAPCLLPACLGGTLLPLSHLSSGRLRLSTVAENALAQVRRACYNAGSCALMRCDN